MAITTVHNELIAVNAISGTLIADNAITATHIATNAVSGTLIADNGVTTVHIAQNNVTSTSIVANAITSTQLADNAVIANKIPDGTIATAHLADNAVTAAKIPDNVLTATMLPDNVILATHIPNATALNLGTITSTGNLSMATDDATIYIGADLDLRVTHSGTSGTITNNTGDLLLDVAGDIILDADGGDTRFRDGGAGFFTITNSSLDAVLKVEQSNEDLLFKGNDGGSEITALTLDMSDAGAALFNTDVSITTAGKRYYIPRASDAALTGSLYSPTGNEIRLSGAGSGSGVLSFEPSSGSGVAMHITSAGNVGIGTTSPGSYTSIQSNLEVKTSGHGGIAINVGATSLGMLAFVQNGTHRWSLEAENSATPFFGFNEAGTYRMIIDAGGNVGIGPNQSPEATLHLSKSNSGGIGAALVLDNPSTSATSNGCEIAFMNDTGASYAGVSNARIKTTTTTSGNGAAALTFTTWNGSAEAEKMRIAADGKVGIGTSANSGTASGDGLFQVLGGSGGSGNFEAITIQHHNSTTTNDGPSIAFEGRYNSNDWNFGRIKTYNNGSGFGANMDFDIHPADGNQNPTLVTAMTIRGDTSSGARVGIGTTSPNVKFTVGDATNGGGLIRINCVPADAHALTFNHSTTNTFEVMDFLMAGSRVAQMYLNTNGLSMPTGRFGVGLSNISSSAAIHGYAADNDSALLADGVGRVNLTVKSSESGGQTWYFRTAGTGNYGSGAGDLHVLNTAGTTITTWDYSASTFNGDLNDTSDRNLKKNITTLTDGTTAIKALRPVSFDWKDETKANGVSGFLAQEVKTVLPNDVSGEEYDSETNLGSMAVNTTGILAQAVKAIQELEARIAALE